MSFTTIPAAEVERIPAVQVTDEQYEALPWIGCPVKSITVDFLDHTAIVTTAGGCVSMGDCIATVMRLDPSVENIQTIDGNAFGREVHQLKDTQYVKDPQRGWVAIGWDEEKPRRGEYCGTAFVVERLQELLLAALRATRRCAGRGAT